MLIKKMLKMILMRFKSNIILDFQSDINIDVVSVSRKSGKPTRIFRSYCSFERVGEGCSVSDSYTYGSVSLGNFVSITGPGTVIKALGAGIQIGSFCSIGQNVCIVDFGHNVNKITSSFINYIILDKSYKNDIVSNKMVVIEEDVWIGSNTVVMPGVKIGRGSIIGAGSIVTKNIPRYSIAYGNPAIIRGMRFDNDVVSFLEDIKWWEWGVKKINDMEDLFTADIKSLIGSKCIHY